MHRFKLLLFSAAVMAMTACSGNKQDSTVPAHNVFTVTPQPLGADSRISLPAVVEEARSISIGFKTAGQIHKIYVKEGQHIAAGQTIAELDTVDYALGIAALREKYDQLKIENERRSRLHATGNMSDNDYENALSGMRQLALQLQLEENKLAYCKLSAPASGVITKVNFEVSEMVDAGTPVVELMDNSSLEVVVDLPSRLFVQRENFSSFTATSALESGREFNLELLSVTPRADNTQLFRMRLKADSNASSLLTPGMNLSVKIAGNDAGERRVTLPLSAIFSRKDKTFVWIVNPADSVISAREVLLTRTDSNGTVEIADGVTPSDVVVRAGVNHLSDGEKVVIISESETNPGNVI